VRIVRNAQIHNAKNAKFCNITEGSKYSYDCYFKGLTFCNFMHCMLSAFIRGELKPLESVRRKHTLGPLTRPHQSEMLF